MNIFVLDNFPKFAAEYHCDKHVVKMIVETAQLLSTAHHINGSDVHKDAIYKSTHVNHPCSLWVRESLENYHWAWELATYLCEEYAKRYRKIHKTMEVVKTLSSFPRFNNYKATPFCQAMPEKYRQVDAVNAYRQYYINEKMHIATWKTEIPIWWG